MNKGSADESFSYTATAADAVTGVVSGLVNGINGAATSAYVAVDSGNEHIVLTHEETEAFSAALAPVVDKWIAATAGKGFDGKALVDAARAAIAKHTT